MVSVQQICNTYLLARIGMCDQNKCLLNLIAIYIYIYIKYYIIIYNLYMSFTSYMSPVCKIWWFEIMIN